MCPANVESMFYAGEVPWHGLGQAVPSEVNSEEAIKLAGLDWEVETAPVFAKTEGEISFEVPVPDVVAIVRKQDLSILGTVGNRYTPIQNRDAFKFFDAVVGEGKAIYHTAGSLFGGKLIWILAKLPGDIRIGKDDITEKYLLLSNSHDGSSTLKMLLTPVRVVCSNTINLALSDTNAVRNGLSIRHTKSAPIRMEEAERMLTTAQRYYTLFNERAQMLAKYQYQPFQLTELVQRLFPADENGDLTPAKSRAREEVNRLFDEGRGHNAPEIRGTAWAALNGAIEYFDHNGMRFRGGSVEDKLEKRLDSIWFGAAAEMKQAAFNIISQQVLVGG